MKKFLLLIVSAILLFSYSCNDLSPIDELSEAAGLKSGKKVMNFTAHLSGDQEVPAVETKATGQAIFQLSKDGMELSYKVIVANIIDVKMSHIHIAPAGTNGGVVVWLFPDGPPPGLLEGKTNGILVQGTITADNLTGSLAGMQLSDLLDAMMTGNAYVNVHTVAHGGGEIRGQIMSH